MACSLIVIPTLTFSLSHQCMVGNWVQLLSPIPAYYLISEVQQIKTMGLCTVLHQFKAPRELRIKKSEPWAYYKPHLHHCPRACMEGSVNTAQYRGWCWLLRALGVFICALIDISEYWSLYIPIRACQCCHRLTA